MFDNDLFHDRKMNIHILAVKTGAHSSVNHFRSKIGCMNKSPLPSSSYIYFFSTSFVALFPFRLQPMKREERICRLMIEQKRGGGGCDAIDKRKAYRHVIMLGCMYF